MTLQEILAGATLKRGLPAHLASLQVSGLEYDSRRVQPGSLFFAFSGSQVDGRKFAAEAAARGAVATVCELPPAGTPAAPWIEVEHGRQALAMACRNLYAGLAERLVLTGITGTNGKTTVSILVDWLLRHAGKTTALIGTIEYRLAGEARLAANTTPESLDLYRLFVELEQAGGTHVTMEVSSHGLALGRVHGVPFHTAVFTNLSRDHLDFHGTMEAYFEAKKLLFAGREAPPPRYAVLNLDDEWGRTISPAPASHAVWYGCRPDADLSASNVETGFEGLRFDLTWRGEVRRVVSPLLGRMNVHNILAAVGAGLCQGLELDTMIEGVATLKAIPGRFERVEQGQPFLVVVDYAHTDDALRNALATARALSTRRVITVFGCGGDRDRQKRPMMGEAAAEGSDYVVLTSDNPRSEDPLAIMNDAMVGLRRHDVPLLAEPDRRTAIRRAILEAQAEDLVLIAGKGHETYQTLKEHTIPFDDREVAKEILREFGYEGGQT